MKTKPFRTIVTGGSEEELAARVADNELRGFEVIGRHIDEKEYIGVTNNKYETGEGRWRRSKSSSVQRKYMAVMQRENVEVDSQ